MTIASEITRLNTAKADIKTAIEAKGVSVPTNAKLDTYDTYVSQISGGGGGWQRPSDWIDISTVADNEIKLLVSDQCYSLAFVVTTASGTYSIDWGDGNTETGIASGTTKTHRYTLGAGQACSEGYTTFAVRIYGASANITSFKVTGDSNNKSVTRQYSPILWANFGTQGITDYSNTFYKVSSPTVSCYLLKEASIPSFANCSSTSYMFSSCSSLEKINLPNSWGGVTNASYMFQSCGFLSITLPNSWGNITNTSYMLSYNYRLIGVKLPSSMGNITDASGMFNYCQSIRYINNDNYIGSSTNNCNMELILDWATNMDSFTTSSKLSKIEASGAYYGSTQDYKLNLSSLRLLNANSTFTGSSPQVNVSYTNLSASALNTLFGDLPTLTGKTIKITGATGAATCNTSIATAKGWTVTN